MFLESDYDEDTFNEANSITFLFLQTKHPINNMIDILTHLQGLVLTIIFLYIQQVFHCAKVKKVVIIFKKIEDHFKTLYLPRIQEIADTETFWQEFHKTFGIGHLAVREETIAGDQLGHLFLACSHHMGVTMTNCGEIISK